MSLEQAADEWVALKERISAPHQGCQFREVKGLQVAAHVQHRKPLLGSQGLDIRSGAEMVVHTVPFARAGVTGVEEHHLLEAMVEVGMEAGQGAVERALADTGWAGEDDQSSGSRGRHAAFWVRESWIAEASPAVGQNSKRRSADFRKDRNERVRRWRR